MKESPLAARLKPIAQSYRRYCFWRESAVCVIAACLAGAVLILAHALGGWSIPHARAWLLGLTFLALLAVWWRSRSKEPDFRAVARRIEQTHPKLNALLLAAVEQKPDPLTNEFSYLQERVIREALAHHRKNPWDQSISETLFFTRFLTLGAVLVLLIVLASVPQPLFQKGKAIQKLASQVEVSPGDTSVERGSGMVVLARFNEPLPSEATLVIDSTGEKPQRIPLVKNLDDPVFGGTIPEVTAEMTYRVEYRGEQTRDFRVTVFEYPTLLRADSDLTYPDYTGLPPKHTEDTRRVSQRQHRGPAQARPGPDEYLRNAVSSHPKHALQPSSRRRGGPDQSHPLALCYRCP
jgi:hypothetical protein